MHVCVYVCMYACVHVCFCVCVSVCVSVCVCDVLVTSLPTKNVGLSESRPNSFTFHSTLFIAVTHMRNYISGILIWGFVKIPQSVPSGKWAEGEVSECRRH
jgi:hypothetical protein